MLDDIGVGAWIDVVLLAVAVMAYIAWFLKRHLPAPRRAAIVLEVCIVVVVAAGIYVTAVRSPRG